MFTYTIIDENTFKVVGENYKSIFKGTEEDAQRIVNELTQNIIDGKKNTLVEELKNLVDEKLALFNSKYPKEEQKYFSTYEEEYRTYIKDKNAPTPYLDTLAEIRGITRDEMAQKIGEKSLMVTKILAFRHKLKDQLKEANTVQQLDEIESIINKLKEINSFEEFQSFLTQQNNQ